jgi:hypothetical protein
MTSQSWSISPQDQKYVHEEDRGSLREARRLVSVDALAHLGWRINDLNLDEASITNGLDGHLVSHPPRHPVES